MIKINVTESASLVTEHLENTLSPSFFFHILLCNSLIPKWMESVFRLQILPAQYPHNEYGKKLA